MIEIPWHEVNLSFKCFKRLTFSFFDSVDLSKMLSGFWVELHLWTSQITTFHNCVCNGVLLCPKTKTNWNFYRKIIGTNYMIQPRQCLSLCDKEFPLRSWCYSCISTNSMQYSTVLNISTTVFSIHWICTTLDMTMY